MGHKSDIGLTAATLRLTNIPGTARVKLAPSSAAGMSIELSGPDSLIKDISWQVTGDVLHVSGPENGGGGVMVSSFGPDGARSVISAGRGSIAVGGDMVISAGRGMTVSSRGGGPVVISTGGGGQPVIVDGKVVSGGGDPAESGEVKLTVIAPAGTAVQISDDSEGSYDIGDILGSLDLRIKGFSRVRAGQMRTTRISVGGSADITISTVTTALRGSISGSGNISVPRGNVSRLQLSVSGSGRIDFGGVAEEADLDVSGSGRIRVDTVTGALRKDVSGSGRIDVRVQPQRSAGTFWS